MIDPDGFRIELIESAKNFSDFTIGIFCPHTLIKESGHGGTLFRVWVILGMLIYKAGPGTPLPGP